MKPVGRRDSEDGMRSCAAVVLQRQEQRGGGYLYSRRQDLSRTFPGFHIRNHVWRRPVLGCSGLLRAKIFVATELLLLQNIKETFSLTCLSPSSTTSPLIYTPFSSSSHN